MISTSTTTPIPFTPPWLEGADAAVTLLLRAGTVIERGQMEAELAGTYQAAMVWPFELRAAVRAGIETLLADDPGCGQMLDLLDAEGQGDAPALSSDDQQLLTAARGVLAEHWQPYRDLIAQQQRRKELAPIVALRRFCTNITGPNITFARGPDGCVSEATLQQLDPLVMQVAGSRAYQLQFATAEARNFPPPLPSDDSREASTSEPPLTGGSLGRKSGRKTRGSRSPNGSGR